MWRNGKWAWIRLDKHLHPRQDDMSHIKTPISKYFATQDDYKKYGEPTEKEEDNGGRQCCHCRECFPCLKPNKLFYVPNGCLSSDRATIKIRRCPWQIFQHTFVCSLPLINLPFAIYSRSYPRCWWLPCWQDLLDLAPCLTPTSRLACQVGLSFQVFMHEKDIWIIVCWLAKKFKDGMGSERSGGGGGWTAQGSGNLLAGDDLEFLRLDPQEKLPYRKMFHFLVAAVDRYIDHICSFMDSFYVTW